MAKYDWNTFRNYIALLAGEMAPGTRSPHQDSELTSCYHDAFLPWGHYHNNIVLFYQGSPITPSHFMDATDRAIKSFYCILNFQKSLCKTFDLTNMYMQRKIILVHNANPGSFTFKILRKMLMKFGILNVSFFFLQKRMRIFVSNLFNVSIFALL